MNWKLLSNSLWVSTLATLGCALTGWLAALWVIALPRRGKKCFFALSVLALAIPPFVATNCWIYLLGWNGILKPFVPFNIYSFAGAIFVMILLFWPVSFIALLGAWQQIDRNHLEQESQLAGQFLLQHLLYPMARPALLQSSLLTFVLIFNHFAVPAILQVRIFPAELWLRFNTTFNFQEALALSWPMILFPVLLLIASRPQPLSWSQMDAAPDPLLFRRRLGMFWFAFAGFAAVAVAVLSVGFPLLQLILPRNTWTQLPVSLATAQNALGYSLLYASGASILSTLLGAVLWRWHSPFCWIFFFVPGVLIGIFFIYLFNRAPFSVFYPSAGLVIGALTLRFLGWGQSGARLALSSVGADLVDEARLAGATPWQLFRCVYWPQCARRFALIAYLTYLLCLWDTETVLLLVPPGGESLALRVFNLLHYGHNPQINALCLLLLLAALGPFLFWHILPRRVRAGAGLGLLIAIAVTGTGTGTGCNPAASTPPNLTSQIFGGVQIIGSRGTGPGQFNKPRSVALDARDNLYVVDMTGRVQKFSPDGVFVGAWQMSETDLGKPKGMDRDQDGNIVVIEPHYSRLSHFAPSGKLVSRWGEHGTNWGQLMFPRAAAVNSHGEVYVSEYGARERVQRFSRPGGECLNSFGRPGGAPGEFNRAEGLGVDQNDRVYVADSCNHRIQVFTREGTFLRTYGRPGVAPGGLNYPYDVRIDSEGRQYVCEFGNSRVQVFDQQDQTIEILGGAGSVPGKFNNPWSLALDSAGNLYVADSLNHRVQKFLRRRPDRGHSPE